MKTMIAISVTPTVDFQPAFAIRGEVIPVGTEFAVKDPTFPASIIPGGSGPYLGRDAFGHWHLRDRVQGQDERFSLSSNGYLVCAHRGSAPAFVDCPVQTWSE